MAIKLRELVIDLREIFRGDPKKTKGPEAFSLMKTQMEVLEGLLRDEEATQSRKAVRFNFASEADGSDYGSHTAATGRKASSTDVRRRLKKRAQHCSPMPSAQWSLEL